MNARSATVWSRWLAQAVFGVAAPLLVLHPQRADLILQLPPDKSIRIVLPVAFWLVVAAYACVLVRLEPRRLRLARFAGLALSLHLLLLLAASAYAIFDDLTTASVVYRGYTRALVAAVLAFAFVWLLDAVRGSHGPEAGAMAVPFGIAVVLLGRAVFAVVPPVAFAGVALVVAWLLARDRVGPHIARLLQRVTSNERTTLWAILLAGTALRIAYTMRVMSNPAFIETGSDGPVYDQLAWGIAQGRPIPLWFSEQFPLNLLGYVRFVAAVYASIGHSYFAVCAIQSVLGGLVCVMTYDLAKRLWSTGAARIAAIFVVTSFQLVFAAAALGHQGLDVFLTVGIVWLLVRLGDRAGWGALAWVGVILGAAITVRETNAFLWAFMTAWLLLVFRRWVGIRRAIVAAVTLTAAAGMLVLPLTAIKLSSPRERTLLRTHLRRLLLGPVAADGAATPRGPDGTAARPVSAEGRSVRIVLGKMAGNFDAQFFRQDEYGTFDLFSLVHDTRFYEGFWLYAWILAGCGMGLACRGQDARDHLAPYRRLIVGVVAARTFPHLFLESAYRHRAPIEPFLIFFAAGAFALTLARSVDGESTERATAAARLGWV